jgi:hypothetical protein
MYPENETTSLLPPFDPPGSYIPNKDLISHHHDPQQKYRPHHTKRKHSLPALADTPLLQPGQRLHCLPRWLWIRAKHKQVAIGADGPRRPPELYRNDDKANYPEDEQDEAAYHDDRWEQTALEDEPEEKQDECDDEGGDGDVIWEVPVGETVSWR